MDQWARWRQDGYVVIPSALSPAEVARYLAVVDDALSRVNPEVTNRHSSFTDVFHHLRRVRNAVSEIPELISLIDHTNTLGILVELMGEHLHLVGSEVFARSTSEDPAERFHTDGGLSLQHVATNDASLTIQLKLQYFLTDVTETDSGNFMLLPGSHRRRPERTTERCFIEDVNRTLDAGEYPEGTVQLRVRAGDAVAFPWNLWHGVARNVAGMTRRSVILRYGQLWCRPIDYLVPSPAAVAVATSRQRRLLGYFGSEVHPADFYKPQAQREILRGPAGE